MALNVVSNFAANVAHRNLVVSDRGATRDIAKLSSGLRVLGARDDAASLAIGSRLKAEVGALRQANVNAGQANSLLQVADGALNTVADILFRLKVLSVQSGSDNIGQAERAALQLEFVALQEEIGRIARDTEFNGVQLINGEERIVTQIGDDEAAEAGAGLRAINNTIGPQQGITDIQFSDNFDATLVEISYATQGLNGVFTVTDLSQGVGSAAGRTATGTTALPVTAGLKTDILPGQTETIDVVFDRGGVNERTVSITIDETFDKRDFNPVRLNPTGTLTGLGFDGAAAFTVGTYGGDLAGLSDQITADATTAAATSRLRIANASGDDLVATTTVGFDAAAANTVQDVRFENAQGDFINATINIGAAALANYAALQDETNPVTSLILGNLDGQGNDLVTGSTALTASAIAKTGTIANALNEGNIAVREIGGSSDNTAISLSFDALTNSFTGTIGGVTGTASESLSGKNGEAGTTTVAVGGRQFEVTVSGDFNRAVDITNAESRITALPNGFVGTFEDGDLEVRITGFTIAANQTIDSVLAGLTSADFSITGDDAGGTDILGATFGDFTGGFGATNDIIANGATAATLTDANGNQIAVEVVNNTAQLIAAGAGAPAADLLLDAGETITFQATGLSNTAISGASGTTGASFDIVEVSGDLAGLDNRARLEKGAAGRELTAAVISIAHSDAKRGDLRAEIDLTAIGSQTVVLRNDAEDSVTLNINLAEGAASIAARLAAVDAIVANRAAAGAAVAANDQAAARAAINASASVLPAVIVAASVAAGIPIPERATGFTEEVLERRGTFGETFFLLGELRQSATFGKSSSDERSFAFKIGSGVLEEDSVVFDVGAANLDSLGLQSTGPDAIRIDGADVTNADNASLAVSAAIDQLSNVRSIIGAGQNRLEFAANNVAAAIENAEAARSTLLDLDVAAGITSFTSKQVLVQTGISMLAQANQLPQQLLRLFQ